MHSLYFYMQSLKLLSKGTPFFFRPYSGLGVLIFLTLTGCPSEKGSSKENDQKSLIARGKVVYATNCTACHHPDPKKPGNLGPEVFGSTKELLEARVLRKDYPQGYTPKRKTNVMTPLPQLKNDIEALTAYLNNSDDKK